MMQSESEREPTTTLHLGLRSVVENAPGEIISKLLSTSDEPSRVILQSILTGPANQAMLVIHKGPAKGSRFHLTDEPVLIGRASESAIFLDDVTVSRKHAQITFSESRFRISDSGSLNGTYLNNKGVTESILEVGDELQIGKFHLIFIARSVQVETKS